MIFWTNCHILVLLYSACCCSAVFALNDQSHDKGKQIITKNGSEKFLSAPLRFNSRKTAQFVTGRARFAERVQPHVNKQESVDKPVRNTQYHALDNFRPAGEHLDNNHHTVTEEIPETDLVHESSTSLDSRYPETHETVYAGNQNGAFNEQSDHWSENGNFKQASLDVTKLKMDELKSDGDVLPCPPCNCSYETRRSVIANCVSKRLFAFPLELPIDTVAINLSFNFLKYLNVSSFLSYPSLLNVTLTFNKKLNVIKNNTLGNQTSNLRCLNLTSCGINTIQGGSFDLTPNLTNLTISYNKLDRVKENAFKGLRNLKHLDLSSNNISFIEMGSFNDLNSLVLLDLSLNRQLGYSDKKFSPALFTHLIHVQQLLIHNNDNGDSLSYPNKALQKLVELQKLSIDGLGGHVEFGIELQSLKNLVSLEIRGNCRIVNITETFFENIPFLKSFKMTGCNGFGNVHPNAYKKLLHLESISITFMQFYDIDNAFQDLKGLQKSQLKSITFNKLKEPRYQWKYLGKEHALCLKNINVEYLDLSLNEIALLGNDFLQELPKTLKTLILRKNKFTSGTQSMNNMAVLTGLTELDLSMQNMRKYSDKRHCFPDDCSELHCRCKHTRHRISNHTEENRPSKEFQIDFRLEIYGFCNHSLGEDLDCVEYDRTSLARIKNVKIPPKMKILRASNYNSFGTQILTVKLTRKNSLSVIDFSNSLLFRWGTGSLPPNITEANLSYNYCPKISTDFFEANNSHIRLYLNNNILGEDFANDSSGQIFSQLSKTTHLDISSNHIYKLPKQFFSGLPTLISLKMADNRLSMLNVTLAHMKTLQFIDLSRNSINWIDAETRNDLDVIAASQKQHIIKIDLTMNPLPCTCDGLELISWMATTNVHFQNKDQLMCYPDNKVAEPIGDLEERRKQLQRLCMGKSVYIIGCVAGLAVVMVTVTFGLMYRYRWKLRYLHNTAMAALLGYKPDVSINSGCTFDAYFVYTTEIRQFVLETCLKELEVKRGHRLCVEDRDFLAGTYIVSNIVSAVRNSTKTVVVMTTDLFEDPYCEYSFKMAVMEEMFKHRTVLHLLMYQQVSCDQMSHEQLEVMKRNSYIEYPPDEGADDNVRQKFWDELSQAIGHSGSDNPEPVLDIE